jgi:hypothetical protein
MGKKKRKQPNPGLVIIPVGHPNPPEPHEEDAAKILARHFRCTVEFLIPVDDYKRKTADILMLGVEWEIKCPTGASRSTISNILRWASKQSHNVIIDTRYTKLDDEEIEKKVRLEASKKSSIKKAILINKLRKVVEIQM